MASRTRQRRGAVAKIIGFSVWIAIVTLFLLWQATSYRGIMSLVGEWQFNAFGRHYPTFNYVLLVFLLCLPGYLLFLQPRKRAVAERPEAATFRSARALFKAVVGATIGLGVGALVILVVMLFLPSANGPAQTIDLSGPAPAVLAEGPTTISGRILYERTAGFDEDMLLVRHSFRFAPIVGPRQTSADVRFFVQLPPFDSAVRGPALSATGVLKRNGLPGEIVRLFRYAGYQVEEPNYVLFVDPAAMRWPYWTLMVQFVVGAVLASMLGLVQRRRVHSIDQAIHSRQGDALAVT